jgi:hypothetical protein
MAADTKPTYTIRFPYKAPDLCLRGTGRWVAACDIPDGALFMPLRDGGRVYEKLGTHQCACLLPWAYEVYDLDLDTTCELMEPAV